MHKFTRRIWYVTLISTGLFGIIFLLEFSSSLIWIVGFVTTVLWTLTFRATLYGAISLEKLGLKDEDLHDQTLLTLFLNWLQKNWIIQSLTVAGIAIPVILVFASKQLGEVLPIVWGITFIFIGLSTLVATYKKLSLFVDNPLYILWKMRGYEKAFTIFAYLGSLFLALVGLRYIISRLFTSPNL